MMISVLLKEYVSMSGWSNKWWCSCVPECFALHVVEGRALGGVVGVR